MAEARYRKRPIEVEAICWNGQNLGSVQAFASGALGTGTVEGGVVPLWVAKSAAVCRVEHGDWIIRETDGSGFYPCAADVFAATYEPVGTDPETPLSDAEHTPGRTGYNTISRAELGAYFRRRGHDHGGGAAAAVFDDIAGHRGPGDQPAETPLSDAEHRLGQVRMKAESMAEDRDETVRRCGEQVLAVLGADETAGGVDLIRTERLRQIAVEGYTPEHDAGHDVAQLARAAACYALHAAGVRQISIYPLGDSWPWPWPAADFKPGAGPLDSLVKAGALIAAEIDRIAALKAQEGSDEEGDGR